MSMVVLVVMAMAAAAILSLPTRIELGIRFDREEVLRLRRRYRALPDGAEILKRLPRILQNKRILSTDIAMRIAQPESSRPVPGHEPRG